VSYLLHVQRFDLRLMLMLSGFIEIFQNSRSLKGFANSWNRWRFLTCKLHCLKQQLLIIPCCRHSFLMADILCVKILSQKPTIICWHQSSVICRCCCLRILVVSETYCSESCDKLCISCWWFRPWKRNGDCWKDWFVNTAQIDTLVSTACWNDKV